MNFWNPWYPGMQEVFCSAHVCAACRLSRSHIYLKERSVSQAPSSTILTSVPRLSFLLHLSTQAGATAPVTPYASPSSSIKIRYQVGQTAQARMSLWFLKYVAVWRLESDHWTLPRLALLH